MFIKYNPKAPHVKTIPVVANSGGGAVPLASDSIIIRPGTNELTEAEWAAIQPHIQDEIKAKIIVPFTVEVKKAGAVTKARTLKDVPVSVARKIIESCQNVSDLKKWVKQELSDEIMLLVLKRLRKLKIDPDEFSDDITGEDTLDADITPEGTGAAPEPGTASKADSEDDDDPEDDTPSPENGVTGEGEGDDPEDDGDNDNAIPDFDGSRSQW